MGVWADTQRQNLKKNKLSEERKERLEALGFVWDQLAAQWEEGFRELSAYHQEHGNCDVSQSHITDTGFKLGLWVSNQRQFLKKNKLSEERKERLEALGFVWEPKKRRPSI